MSRSAERAVGDDRHITAFVIVGCGWGASVLLCMAFGLQAVWEIAAIGLTFQWMCLWRVDRDPLDPAILLGGTLLFLYLWTPLAAQLVGAPLLSRDAYGREELTSAVLLVGGAFNILVLGCYAGYRSHLQPRFSERGREALLGSAGPATVLVLGVTLITAFVVVQIMGAGLSSYLERYFEIRLMAGGWSHLLDVAAAPAVHVGTALVWYRWLVLGRPWRSLPGVITVLLAAAIATFVVSRMAFVVLGLTLVLLHHYYSRRISIKRLALISVAATLVLVVWGSYRESTLTGQLVSSLVSPRGAAIFFLSGFDHLDTLIQTLRGLELGVVELQFGRPWWNTVLPLPRSMIEWKPPTSSHYLGVQLFGLGGRPESFWRAASLLPDLYVNFSLPGVLLGAGGIGWLAARLYMWRGTSPIAGALYCVLLPYFVRAIRDELALAGRWALVALALLWMLFLLGSWLTRSFGASGRAETSAVGHPG